MVALRVRIGLARNADAQDGLRKAGGGSQRVTQFDPIRTSPALDDVIDRGGRETGVNQMAMIHGRECRRHDRSGQGEKNNPLRARNRLCSSDRSKAKASRKWMDGIAVLVAIPVLIKEVLATDGVA